MLSLLLTLTLFNHELIDILVSHHFANPQPRIVVTWCFLSSSHYASQSPNNDHTWLMGATANSYYPAFAKPWRLPHLYFCAEVSSLSKNAILTVLMPFSPTYFSHTLSGSWKCCFLPQRESRDHQSCSLQLPTTLPSTYLYLYSVLEEVSQSEVAIPLCSANSHCVFSIPY